MAGISLDVKIRTLTPIWTGGVNKTNDKLYNNELLAV
jgi:hypothetical protein